MMAIEQKGIYWTDLNPTQGSEQSGKRPVVVISGQAMNKNVPICIVCPISSNIKEYPASVFLKADKQNNLKKDSEVLAFQVRTVSSRRLRERIGSVSNEQLNCIVSELNDIFRF